MSLFLPWITLCQEQTCAFFLPVVDLLEGLRELGVVVVLKLDLLGRRGHEARDEERPSRQHAEHMGWRRTHFCLSSSEDAARMNGRS